MTTQRTEPATRAAGNGESVTAGPGRLHAEAIRSHVTPPDFDDLPQARKRGSIVSTALVKELRDRTGAGIMDSKRALEEAGGNLEKAAEILRQQGIARAGKKAGREARQGLVDTYIHAGGRIGSMVELNCETDFVARTDDFRSLAHDVAMQVVATSPRYVSPDEVGPREREAGLREHGDEKRFLETEVLLAQPFIRDPRRTIGDLVQEAIGKLGENIVIRRVMRFEVGEASSNATVASE
jgi:elongation factor Ts